jgi:hypothetical protein
VLVFPRGASETARFFREARTLRTKDLEGAQWIAPSVLRQKRRSVAALQKLLFLSKDFQNEAGRHESPLKRGSIDKKAKETTNQVIDLSSDVEMPSAEPLHERRSFPHRETIPTPIKSSVSLRLSSHEFHNSDVNQYSSKLKLGRDHNILCRSPQALLSTHQ